MMSFRDEKVNMEKIRLCQEIVDEIQMQSRRPVYAHNDLFGFTRRGLKW